MKNKAFTLIELMVTVAIIGILASIVTVNLQSARVKGKDAKRKADIEAVAASLEIYYTQNKEYPKARDWEDLKDKIYPSYISTWPVDPKEGSGNFPDAYKYYYSAPDDGSMFALDAKLEGKEGSCEDSGYSANDEDKFYTTGTICEDSDNKFHYRVAGR